MQEAVFQPRVNIRINISTDELMTIQPELRLRVEAIIKQNEDLLAQLQKTSVELGETQNKDALTGCANREAFNKKIEMYLRVMRRYKTAQQRGYSAEMPHISVITLTLSGIQQINKYSGHRAMDMTLKEAAQFFNNHLRPDDFFARIGAEQFAIIMTTTQEHADQAMKRLRREFETTFTGRGQTQPYLSFHYGACQMMPQHVTLIQLLQQCTLAQKAEQAYLTG